MTLFSAFLIGVGFVLLIATMWKTQNLIRILPDRGQWPSLRNLMAFFAVGYAVYFICLVIGRSFNKDLITAEVFLLSSLFMLMVVGFTYRTVHDILRLDELEELANMDELTGLFNRRAIMHLLEEKYRRAKRFGFPLSVAMVDLDHFKRVNDEYGHIAGDTVLTEIAQVLKGGLRRIDVLGRYGGEEFLCILPITTDEGAIVSGERIRLRVKKLRFEVAGPDQLRPLVEGEVPSGDTVDITVSVGVATTDPSMTEPEHLVSAADAALYKAKEEGRDRTCSASEQSI